ncbi:MAG: DNA polymerase III subunit delta [Phycisphaerales bacterium]
MAKRETKPAAKEPAKGSPAGASAPKPGTYGPATVVALFKGADAYLRSAYTDKLRAEIEKAGTPVEVLKFDGASASAADVLDECRSFGLMAQHKLVVVDQADEFLKESTDEDDEPSAKMPGKRGRAPVRARDLVEAYIKSPTMGATLVLRAETWRKGNLDKAIEAVGIIEDCESPTADKAAAALVRRARETLKCELEPEAARLIVERVGTDLGLLVQELAKLGTMAGPGGTITTAQVREMVGLAREEEAWGLGAVLLSGDAGAALAHARELMEVSRIDEVLLRFVIMDTAKKLHAFARGAEQGVPSGVTAKEQRVWPADRIPAFAEAARRVSGAGAARLLERAVEMDARGKSGRGDVTIGVETLVVEFAGVVRG